MTFEQLTADTSIGKVSYYKAGSGHPLIYIHSENGFFHNGAIKELIKKFQVFVPIIPGFENTSFLEKDLFIRVDFPFYVYDGNDSKLNFNNWVFSFQRSI